MNPNRRDLAIFVLGAAAGMIFMLVWASRGLFSPMFATYMVAQVCAAVTLGAGLWLLFKK